MLALDGVGKSYILFFGLDVSQCPMHGDIKFHNETFHQMHVALRKAGQPAIAFELDSGKNRNIEDLEGDFDLSVTHISRHTSAECSGHGAKLTITKLDQSSTEVS